jgi:hypothetical protein
VAQHDVGHEQRTVGERKYKAERLVDDADIGQQVDAANRQRQRERIPTRPGAERGQHDWPGKLDSADGAQREAGNRQVEARVHGGEDDAERHQRAELRRRQAAHQSPGSAPHRKDDRGARNAQPRNTQDVHLLEQENGEGRAEVVEHGAHQEVRVGRDGRPTLRCAPRCRPTFRWAPRGRQFHYQVA